MQHSLIHRQDLESSVNTGCSFNGMAASRHYVRYDECCSMMMMACGDRHRATYIYIRISYGLQQFPQFPVEAMSARRGSFVPQAVSLASKQLCSLLYPSVLTILTALILRRWSSTEVASHLSAAKIAFAAFLVVPFLKLKLRELVEWWKAAQLGGVFPPRIQGKSIGNMDVLATVLESVQNGFLSTSAFVEHVCVLTGARR